MFRNSRSSASSRGDFYRRLRTESSSPELDARHSVLYFVGVRVLYLRRSCENCKRKFKNNVTVEIVKLFRIRHGLVPARERLKYKYRRITCRTRLKRVTFRFNFEFSSRRKIIYYRCIYITYTFDAIQRGHIEFMVSTDGYFQNSLSYCIHLILHSNFEHYLFAFHVGSISL